jgi:peptidoglycan/xylan/chitin deacetylase (PgdA/CDA1 family)
VKRILMITLSLAVFAFDECRRIVYALVGKRIPATHVVLRYHSVPQKQRSTFAKQMDELVRRARPLRADVAVPHLAGARFASVTFDDAYQNVLENAIPELARRGIPATLFVVSDGLGSVPSWEDHSYIADPDLHDPIMTEEQLRSLSPDLIQIGSHTHTHPILTRISEAEARGELARSRTRLQEIVGRDVKLFSFPYGVYNDDLIGWCRDAGYDKVFTTLPRSASSETEEFIVGRVAVYPYDVPLEFSLKLSGAYRWWFDAVELKRKLAAAITFATPEKGASTFC